jgi:hypothetical protein
MTVGTGPIDTAENLERVGRRLRDVLGNAATGPLVASSDVMRLADEWEDRWKAEAGGIDCTTWLRKTLGAGRSLGWFERRHRAVASLGEAIRRTIHHDVAVWLVQTFPESDWQRAKLTLMRGCRAQNGNPLTLPQARRIVAKTLGVTLGRGAKPCARCTELEEILKANGIDVPTK